MRREVLCVEAAPESLGDAPAPASWPAPAEPWPAPPRNRMASGKPAPCRIEASASVDVDDYRCMGHGGDLKQAGGAIDVQTAGVQTCHTPGFRGPLLVAIDTGSLACNSYRH